MVEQTILSRTYMQFVLVYHELVWMMQYFGNTIGAKRSERWMKRQPRQRKIKNRTRFLVFISSVTDILDRNGMNGYLLVVNNASIQKGTMVERRSGNVDTSHCTYCDVGFSERKWASQNTARLIALFYSEIKTTLYAMSWYL